MQRHHTGSGRRQAVPLDWGEHHRLAAAGAFNGQVRISGPSSGSTWNPTTEQMEASVGPVVYQGPARVQALAGRGRTVVLAEDAEILVDYLVAVPMDAQVGQGHRVEVLDGHDDPLLEGRTLAVREVVMGTEQFERDLMCQIID